MAEGGRDGFIYPTVGLELDPIRTWPNSNEHLHPQESNFVGEHNSVTVNYDSMVKFVFVHNCG
jgi:hypothetical protein